MTHRDWDEEPEPLNTIVTLVLTILVLIGLQYL